ncbi:hypothetical protein L1286_16885 [Pseudoalteromonas sp. SMS1]|uniref:hypothetical protein n=1 Tax=Pseudoalteromonas sp. SMS1 TaxID=2908894 RepID=UPI001F4382ED|nr:hypothetical protein [Pseudoalteromonas sp. SMS1]MCF2859161.1 hypothetical protein [Pseudoalteromonas sp. SMS1]
MSVWDILKIQETKDVKAIKAAYANQLKVSRPDAHPEAFQTLHSAYKSALNWAKTAPEASSGVNISIETSSIEDISSEQDVVVEAAKDSDTFDEMEHERQAELDEMQVEYQHHIEEITKVFDDKAARNNISAWQFLQHSQLALEPHYNTQLGMFVFENILQINQKFEQLRQEGKRYSGGGENISNETILYLDSVFNWRSQAHSLYYFFAEQEVLKILNLIEAHEHITDASYAINSVQGAKVTEKKSQSINQADEYMIAVEVMARLKTLTYRSFCACLLISGILITEFLNQGIEGGVQFLRVFLVVLLIQVIGVSIRNKYIIYSMWPVSILFILCFPIMTPIGITMFLYLKKVRVYFKYEQR